MRRAAGIIGLAVLAAATGYSLAPRDSESSPITPPTSAVASSSNPFRTGRTLIIPHAGGDGLFPENTLYAYEHSMAMGGEVIDADVQLSGDGVLMAMHDSTVDRTTNATGKLRDMTAAELGKLDAGYRFRRDDDFPFRGQGITIPTIEEILTAFPTSLTTLDLKDQHLDVVGPVCDLLRRLNRTGDVYVGSDTNEQVMEFRATCPEVRTSGTDAERRAMRAAREAGDTSFVTHQLVSQPGLIGDDGTRRVTSETLAFSHSKDIAVLTWVVDDPELLAELIDMGLDGIYTRRPDVMLEVRRQVQGNLPTG